MAGILPILFVGHHVPGDQLRDLSDRPGALGEVQHKTVIAQVAAHGLRRRVIPFYLFQAFTALLLFLAANT